MQPPGPVLSAGVDDEPLDEKEEVLAAAVVAGALHIGQRDGVERVADGRRVIAGNNSLLGEHDEVRVVDRHERRQQLRLRVLEVLVEDEGDVRGVEGH